MNTNVLSIGIFVVVGAGTCIACSDADNSASEAVGGGSDLGTVEEKAQVTQATTSDADYVTTPAGRVHRSCVHEIPSGASIDDFKTVKHNGATIMQAEPCPFPVKAAVQGTAPTINGWIESSNSFVPNINGHDWATEMAGDWTVPVKPAVWGETIYFFNGLEDRSPSTVIIQPVLQFGQDGVNGWQLASWYGGSLFGGNYYHSTPIAAHPGDSVQGFSWGLGSCNSAGHCDWEISATNLTTSTNTVEYVNLNVPMRWAFAGVLEAYNVTSCSNLPGGSSGQLTFDDVALYQPSGSNYNALVQTTFNGDCALTGSPCWTDTVYGGTPSCGYAVGSWATGAVLGF